MTMCSTPASNGSADSPLSRANQVKTLLTATTGLVVPFIAAADENATTKHTGRCGHGRNVLVQPHPAGNLEALLHNDLDIRAAGRGSEGLLGIVQNVLKYSVNTWDQGFLDKLYASANAVGLASELVIAALNTNAHVYQVSPVLTLIEKRTTRYLASLFALPPSTSGGINQPGGSASNSTAIVIARNTLFPQTKSHGNGNLRLTLFTSQHGHYSIEKAANLLGLGSSNVISVPVDQHGCMIASSFEELVVESKSNGQTPFFLNATAGTTVLGSFDPFESLAAICKKHGLWFHIDGSWGASVVFNPAIAKTRLLGSHLADSITFTPHKMLGVPLTCSFLLGRDMSTFHNALTLPANYLFHHHNSTGAQPTGNEIYDLGDLTPQCGRRADSTKFFFALQYYGTQHFSALVARALHNAQYLLDCLVASGHFPIVSPNPLPCLQVCFYYARNNVLADHAEANGKVTVQIVKALVTRGFMVDYAPGEKGEFFRVVVNGDTRRSTLDGLVKAIEEVAVELEY